MFYFNGTETANIVEYKSLDLFSFAKNDYNGANVKVKTKLNQTLADNGKLNFENFNKKIFNICFVVKNTKKCLADSEYRNKNKTN